MFEKQPLTFKSNKQRRVVEDIASWRNESERGKLADDELCEYIQTLSDQEIDELEKIWYQTVGRWLLSRHDMKPALHIGGPDTWLAEQFTAIKTGKETEYGYVRGVTLHPAKS